MSIKTVLIITGIMIEIIGMVLIALAIKDDASLLLGIGILVMGSSVLLIGAMQKAKENQGAEGFNRRDKS